jgi:hypothetical protein
LHLAAEVLTGWYLGRERMDLEADVGVLQETLDLMALLNRATGFLQASVTLVNEVASRHRCGRVSLGWLEDGYVRVKAISHLDSFEKKMDAVQGLESAMEESFDQDVEILWPSGEGMRYVARAHEAFAGRWGHPFLVSLPLRLEGEPIGVLTCERQGPAFEPATLASLRLTCDQAVRRLSDLRHTDRSPRERIAAGVRDTFAYIIGVENTGLKVLGFLGVLVLAFVLFGRWPYRVEGNFLTKTDDIIHMPAPFDSYIGVVRARLGDVVQAGELLVSLDTRELLLEEAATLAEIARCETQEEKARAQKELADMRVAQAQRVQALSKLAQLRYRIENAEIKAPFEGLVVEGDLRKMVGAPVRSGDLLHKVARLDNLYAEIELDERDAHLIKPGTLGEIAFVSRPDLGFPMRVELIEPVAASKEGINVFTARATFSGARPEWWRPGMSGVAKLDTGKQSVLWILTHRAVCGQPRAFGS